MRRIGFRPQRTLARSAMITGRGLLAGAAVGLEFLPAPPNSGVIFVRSDRANARIPAHLDQVAGTQRRTSLSRDGVEVILVEHVLAALASQRIDNCEVVIDAAEPPGLDGSSLAFVESLREAGVVPQPAQRAIYAVSEPVTVGQGGSTLTLHPPEKDSRTLTISYLLDYGPRSPIVPQRHSQRIEPELFRAEIAPCRTFILEEEVAELRRQGIGLHTEVSDLLVFGPHGPICNSLRFGNEPARHKILDIVGDLALLGHDLVGHVVAYRSGHPLNLTLVRTLTQQAESSRERRVA